jgi:hypothetical protein
MSDLSRNDKGGVFSRPFYGATPTCPPATCGGCWPAAPGAGLAAPGMPASAPGMDQPGEAYEVVLFGTPAGERIWARH